MKISRRGTFADHGLSKIEFGSPKISWLESDSSLAIKQTRVKNFSGDAPHSYEVLITVTELNTILKSLVAAAMADPSTFEKSLNRR